MNDTGSITLRALRFFIAVYDKQSFSAVARREGVSASMISRTVIQLENTLGQQLFYRNTRAVIPTEAGHLFMVHARAMLENMHSAQTELQSRAAVPAGLVRINAPVFFGHHHIAPWLNSLVERYPQLQIELNQTDDYIDPHRDAADLIFRIGTLTDSSFHARILGTQRYYLAASPDYVAKHGVPQTPAALNQHRCLVYSGSSGPNRWLFNAEGSEWVHYPVAAHLSSNNAETLLTAALGGMGIVLFPDWMVGNCLRQGTLVELLSDYHPTINAGPQHIAVIYPNTRHPPLTVRAVIDYFVDVYGTPLYWQVT